MPFCPNCEAEYQVGISECVDCQLPLVDRPPLHCPRCEERIEGNPTFCPHCGIFTGLQEAKSDIPVCGTHVHTHAVGMCVVCGILVCDECLVERDGKIFCGDDRHVKVYEDYALVYQTSTDYEAAMIQSNLEGAGIQAKVFSQHDHVYVVNMGQLAVVNVMVPKSQIRDAEEIIASLLSSGDEDESNETGEPS